MGQMLVEAESEHRGYRILPLMELIFSSTDDRTINVPLSDKFYGDKAGQERPCNREPIRIVLCVLSLLLPFVDK